MLNDKKYIIFLVEDDELYAELLSVRIKDTIKSDIIRFDSGEDMLNHFNSSLIVPDLILLDYYLESNEDVSMSGLDVFRNLPEKLSSVPTVIISGSTDYSLVAASLKMGVYDFIHKNENTFDRLENVIFKIKETLNLKRELFDIVNKSTKIQKFAGIAVIAIIAIVSIISYGL